MTAYPVALTYDRRDGQSHSGFAASVDVALEIARDYFPTKEWKNHRVELTSCEIGHTTRSKSDFIKNWRDEIEQGWVTPTQVYGGWVGEARYWAVFAEEILMDKEGTEA